MWQLLDLSIGRKGKDLSTQERPVQGIDELPIEQPLILMAQ
jgi:hypothetical protein